MFDKFLGLIGAYVRVWALKALILFGKGTDRSGLTDMLGKLGRVLGRPPASDGAEPPDDRPRIVVDGDLSRDVIIGADILTNDERGIPAMDGDGAAPEDEATPEATAQEAEAALYAPDAVTRGQTFPVQVIVHPDAPGFAEQADQRARKLDPDAEEHDRTLLDVALEKGDRIEVRFFSDDITVDAAVKSRRWRNGLVRLVFRATTQSDFAEGRVQLYIGDMILGEMFFAVSASEDAPSVEPGRRDLNRFRRVFLSYSSSDRLHVLRHNQLIQRLGMEVFQDVTALQPGDDWRERLFDEIDHADLLLVYWSKAAADSDWVTREIARAMELQRQRPGKRPEICPVLLEGPPPPTPRPEIGSLHVNDPMRYIIYAHEVAATETAHP